MQITTKKRLGRPLAYVMSAFLGLSCVVAQAADTTEWKLSPISGNKPAVWAAAPNWRHSDGNPLATSGAQWSLVTQAERNPSLTSAYELMKPGTYVGYNFLWQSGSAGKDPAQQYRGYTLITRPDGATAQKSRSSAILLKLPAAGRYSVEIAGKASVKQPAAGHALLTVYTLNADRSQAKELKLYSLNNKAPGAFGGYPDTFSYTDTVELAAGEELAVRVQAVNPGGATAGSAAVTFTAFKVSLVAK